jgi:hypothetical protein
MVLIGLGLRSAELRRFEVVERWRAGEGATMADGSNRLFACQALLPCYHLKSAGCGREKKKSRKTEKVKNQPWPSTPFRDHFRRPQAGSSLRKRETRRNARRH